MVRVMVAVLLGVLAAGVSAWPARADVPADVPPVSPAAAADGLIDVRTVVADAVIDLRYATPDNFTGVQLYPADARCLVHESMAPGLATAAATLRAGGERLVFWDCYRPHAVQVRMFEVVPDPPGWPGPGRRPAAMRRGGRSTSPWPRCTAPARRSAASARICAC